MTTKDISMRTARCTGCGTVIVLYGESAKAWHLACPQRKQNGAAPMYRPIPDEEEKDLLTKEASRKAGAKKKEALKETATQSGFLLFVFLLIGIAPGLSEWGSRWLWQ